MASRHSGSWYPVGPIQYDPSGKPYQNTSDGQKNYLSPRAMNPTGPSGIPGGSLLHHHGEFNSETGNVDQPFAWDNLMAMGTAGAMAAPFVAPALGAGGGGAGAGAGTTAAVTTAAAPTAAAGATSMSPIIWGNIIQALAGMGASALAPRPQQMTGYEGDVSAPNMLKQSNDFNAQLKQMLEGLPPLDTTMANATLPDDPSGRVQSQTPRRRPMAPAMSQPQQPQQGTPTQGALQILRSLGVGAAA